ncbi:MAG: hypothetical protein KBS96_00945 [Lachnospiraceae bacterium]|nr:hypothetical protein [Candidatus Colinaster scatohippi]
MEGRRGVLVVIYTIDDKEYRGIWDDTVNLNYLRRVLEHRGATKILINYL